MSRNIKLIIAYEGTLFNGWQECKMGRSVEGELQRALEKLLQHEVVLQAASRTDAGVHARGQVVNFFTENGMSCARLTRALNSLTGNDLSVLSVEEVEAGWHPTLYNIGKQYVYHVCNGTIQLPSRRHFSWHVPISLNVNKMRDASLQLIGTHDFTSFANVSGVHEDRMCHLKELTIEQRDAQIKISLIGDRFLFRMARNLVGTLVYVGLGRIDIDEIGKMLEQKCRQTSGMCAPAHGLFLEKVLYP